jgi:hypothetical protein
VSVRREADGRFLVRLATDERGVNVRLSTSDIRLIVESAHWRERGIMRAGESAGAPVFWASDGNHVSVLIGRDGVETRDVAFTVPFAVVDEIVRGTLAHEVSVTVTKSYEPPPPNDDLVGALGAALAPVPDLQEAYLVVRRTEWPEGQKTGAWCRRARWRRFAFWARRGDENRPRTVQRPERICAVQLDDLFRFPCP